MSNGNDSSVGRSSDDGGKAGKSSKTEIRTTEKKGTRGKPPSPTKKK